MVTVTIGTATETARRLGSKSNRNTPHFHCAELPSTTVSYLFLVQATKSKMREIVHLQAGQCGNQIGAKVYLQRMKRIFLQACDILFFLSF